MKITHFLRKTHNLLFCIVECLGFCNLSLNCPRYFLLVFLFGFLGNAFLFTIVIKNGGHVLSRVAGRGIVIFPKYLQHISIGCLFRIILNLNSLCVITTTSKKERLSIVCMFYTESPSCTVYWVPCKTGLTWLRAFHNNLMVLCMCTKSHTKRSPPLRQLTVSSRMAQTFSPR